MKVGIASDHRGYKVKEKLKKYLFKKGYELVDYGTDSTELADYPDFGIKLGEGIKNKEVELGIAICGTGIGISIACNKVKGVRCAKVSSAKEAKTTRIHNNANIVAFSANMFMFEIKDIVDNFLKTPYIEEERFERRIKKLSKYEGK